MKYFNPTYWFKLWVLSAPLFNSENQGIYAKSIDNNQKIKDWASKNITSLESINQEISYTNSSTNYQPYNLNQTNQNIDPFYQSYLDSFSNQQLETSNHKHRHEKNRRIKKQVRPTPRPNREILQLNERLIINEENPREYQTSFQNIINELVNRGVLTRIRDLNALVNPDFLCEDNTILALNTQVNYGYFRLPVQIRWKENQHTQIRNLELVLRIDNLYLQGFIVNNNYYHFDFRNINVNMQPQAVRDGSVPLLTEIQGTQSRQLTGISPDYRDMIRENDENIYWSNIWHSFFQLINNIDYNFNEQGILIEGALGNLARSLGDVILVTAESLRFWSLHTHIIQQLVNNNQFITLGRNNRNPIYNTLVNWNEESRTQSLIIDLLSTPSDRRPNPNGRIDNAWNILIDYGYLRKQDNKNVDFINWLARILILPINQLTNILGHSNIRIILSYFIRQNLDNCHGGKRKRELNNNNYWHKQFCDLKPQIDKIQGKITTIKVLENDSTENEWFKKGDMFLGTDSGLYTIHEDSHVSKRMSTINHVKNIIINNDYNNAYVINDKCEIYNLKFKDWSYEKTSMESCDLNKELRLYYEDNKENKILHISPVIGDYNREFFKEWNLKNINPVDNFNKLEFLGKVYSDGWGLKVKWGSWIYNGNRDTGHHPDDTYDLSYFMKTKDNRNNKFHDIIKISPDKENFLQKFWDKDGEARLEVNQRFILSWNWDNDIYYLSVKFKQYCEWWASGASLDCWMKMGKGIRLYNDDDTFETQIPNPNDRKRRDIFDIDNLEEKNELKNETKWTNDFTKSINNEQHLSIDNKTNFVTNNITSL